MDRTSLLPLALLACSCAASDYTPGISLYGGVREFDSDLYAPLEQQNAGGAALEWKAAKGGLGWELGGFYSADDETQGAIETKVNSAEGFAGVRWDFGDSQVRVRPYLGAGVSVIRPERELLVSGTSAGKVDDTSAGGYAHAGIMFGLNESLSLGFDLRGVFATDVDFGGGLSGDADYVQGAVVLGFSF